MYYFMFLFLTGCWLSASLRTNCIAKSKSPRWPPIWLVWPGMAQVNVFECVECVIYLDTQPAASGGWRAVCWWDVSGSIPRIKGKTPPPVPPSFPLHGTCHHHPAEQSTHTLPEEREIQYYKQTHLPRTGSEQHIIHLFYQDVLTSGHRNIKYPDTVTGGQTSQTNDVRRYKMKHTYWINWYAMIIK